MRDIALNFTSKDGYSKTADKVIKKTQQIGNETEKTNKLLGGLGKNFKSATLAAAVRKVADYMKTSSEASANYIESLNLLGVAFEGDTKAIREFTSTTAGKLNLDEATLINAAGHFRTLADSMNLSTEAGKDFSQLLTQLNLDLSSLYNVDFDRMQSALQSAVEGQGKSLKQLTGASVLESSVQTQLQALGVDAYVEDMNDSEKAVARLISITYQLQSAQGDLANTIEAPANQMRVFGEQTNMLARNIGNILLPVLSALLPILNGILIAINSILGSIAKLTGFDESDYDFVADTANSFDNLGASVGGVGDSAKKAKKELSGLRGFDKLNVIRTPQESTGSGAGGGGGVGVNPKLLKTLSELLGQYDSKLDGVKTKAQQIADIILEWLHVFDKLKEPVENLASLTFDGLIYLWDNALKPLATWVGYDLIPAFVDLTASGLELIYQVGLKLKPIYKFIFDNVLSPFAQVLGQAIVDSLKDISNMLTLISKSKVLTTILAWIVAFKQLKVVLGLVSKLLGKTALVKSISEVTSMLKIGESKVGDYKAAWELLAEKITPATKKLTTEMTKSQKAITLASNAAKAFKTTMIGLATAFAGFEIMKSSIESINKSGPNFVNVLTLMAGSLVLVAGAIVAVNAVMTIFGASLLANPIGLVITAAAALVVGITALALTINNSTTEVDANTEAMNKNKEKLDELNESAKKSAESKDVEISKAQELRNELLNLVDANGKVISGNEERATYILSVLNDALGTQYKLENGIITTTDGQRVSKDKLKTSTDNYITSLRTEAILEAYKDEHIEALKQQRAARQKLNEETDNYNKKIENLKIQVQEGKITELEALSEITAERAVLQQTVENYDTTMANTTGKIQQYEQLQSDAANKHWDAVNKDLEGYGINVDNTMDTTRDKTQTTLNETETLFKNTYDTCKNEANKSLNGIKINGTYTLNVDANTNKAKESLQSFFKRNSAVFGAAGLNIPTLQYAQGGLPPVGQMFIANERGPELVGQIGGQSFVANQNQMMDIIDKKLQNAGGGIKNATFIVQVGNTKVGQVVLNDLQQMAKDNGKPIKIGV